MKNNHNICQKPKLAFLIFALAMYAFPLLGNSQENAPPLLALVECMKVMPGNEGNYLEVEKNIWKPLHLERTKQGIIVGWYLYKVWYTGTDDKYNYVTVTLFENPAKMEDPWQNIDPAKILPGVDLDKAMKETGASREMVSSSLIMSQAGEYPVGGLGNFKYLQLDYMKVEQGKDGEYFDAEIDIWKPVHAAFIEAGSRVGWSLWGRVFPTGAGLDYQYVTVNYMSDFSKIGMADYNDAFNKAHAGKSMDELFERTNNSRILVKSELWEVIDKVIIP